MRRVIDSLMDEVNNGKFLADGLAEYEYLFGAFFVNIVRVGESSGTLSKNLLYLAEELRRSKELEGKVKSAMVYPLVILCATIAVAGFLTFYIFPKLIPVFGSLNVQLPITTRILLATLGFVKSYGLEVLGGLVILGFGIRIAIKQLAPVKYIFDVAILSTPVLSDVAISVHMVNFTRVLGLLLKSGVKIVEALDITAKTFSSSVYRRFVLAAEEEMKKEGWLSARILQCISIIFRL